MGFVKSLEEIAAGSQQNAVFYDAEMLTVYFETTPEVVKRLLPPPLKPAKDPFGGAFVANYPRTNFGVTYLESALFLLAEYNGEEGAFCLAMPVNNDMALILGREVFGYPKKMADIFIRRDGDQVEGWTERRETRFFEARARLTGKFNSEDAQKIMMEHNDWVGSLLVWPPGLGEREIRFQANMPSHSKGANNKKDQEWPDYSIMDQKYVQEVKALGPGGESPDDTVEKTGGK